MYKGYGLEADLVLHLDDGRYALIHTNKQPPLS